MGVVNLGIFLLNGFLGCWVCGFSVGFWLFLGVVLIWCLEFAGLRLWVGVFGLAVLFGFVLMRILVVLILCGFCRVVVFKFP